MAVMAATLINRRDSVCAQLINIQFPPTQTSLIVIAKHFS